MDGHGLLLSFDRDDPQFTLGFELGRVWAMLRASPDELVAEYVHGSNAEMLLRMAEATSRIVQTEELGDDWLLASFAPADKNSIVYD